MRQLSRRNPRRAGRARRSIASDAAVLTKENDQRSPHLSFQARSPSLFASSAMLLNRRSVGVDSVSVPGGGHSHTGSMGGPQTPTTPGGASAFSYVPGASQSVTRAGSSGGGIFNMRTAAVADPYYRPPRPRRVTMDIHSPNSHSRGSWASGGWGKQSLAHSPEEEESLEPVEGPSVSGRGTPSPAHLGGSRDHLDLDQDDPRRSKTDYAIREVDGFYGVRGPALSHMSTRRLKTGPADPTGHVSVATGWFKGLFGGKTKEKGKGFEVVRSSRLPPSMQSPPGEIALADQAPYKDDPDTPTQPSRFETTRNLELEDEGDAIGAGTRHLPEDKLIDEEVVGGFSSDEDDPSAIHPRRVSQLPPSLPDIEVGDGIGMPSRVGSLASSRPSNGSTRRTQDAPPSVPRKSSRRTSSHGNTADFDFKDKARLSVIPPSPPGSPGRQSIPPSWPLKPSGSTSQRIPFGRDLSPSQTLDLVSTAQTTPVSEEGSGALGTDARHSSSALGPYAAETHEDRPSSLGYVQQHRASEKIHIVHPLVQPMAGSTAEVVEEQRRSITPETRPLP